MKKLISILLGMGAFLMLASCDEKVDLLVSNEQTMGMIADGHFITDQGLLYKVFAKECEGDLFALKRAFIVCDVLREGTEPASYDILLKRFTEVGLPEYTVKSERPEEGVKTDPVMINAMWTSGRYLNFQLVYPAPKGSEQEHVFSFIVYEKQLDGLYAIDLMHDAGGEVFGEWDIEEVDTETRTVMVSLPLESFYKPGSVSASSVPYEVHYTWYVSENGRITKKTLPNLIRGTFRSY